MHIWIRDKSEGVFKLVNKKDFISYMSDFDWDWPNGANSEEDAKKLLKSFWIEKWKEATVAKTNCIEDCVAVSTYVFLEIIR